MTVSLTARWWRGLGLQGLHIAEQRNRAVLRGLRRLPVTSRCSCRPEETAEELRRNGCGGSCGADLVG